MSSNSIPSLPLNDGRKLPQIGLGTWPMNDGEVESAVVAAGEAGFRLFDTALNYGNEVGVGNGLRASGLDRAEAFVTTKIPGRHHGYESTFRSLEESLGNLGLDYVDLYLIHWPLPKKDLYVDTWRAMVELKSQGLARSIGVSNFKPAHLQRLIDETGEVPAVNQVQLHPAIVQSEIRKFDREHDIVTQSWSPLGQGANNLFGDDMSVLEEAAIKELAEKYDKTPGQIILRWHIEMGLAAVPKTSNPQRMRKNLDVFDFALGTEDLDVISQFDLGPDAAADSDNHEEE